MADAKRLIGVRPADVKKGDRLDDPAGTGAWWIAREDAWLGDKGRTIFCRVEYADGGQSMREWNAHDPDIEFEVWRA